MRQWIIDGTYAQEFENGIERSAELCRIDARRRRDNEVPIFRDGELTPERSGVVMGILVTPHDTIADFHRIVQQVYDALHAKTNGQSRVHGNASEVLAVDATT